MLNLLNHFAEFFPEHKNKRLYGILAAVDTREALRERVLKEGVYLASIHDNLFEFVVPENLVPRSFF